jgi:ABC-type transport system involved in cytochrome bd biosynthesis fused ATPase/permease subunit
MQFVIFFDFAVGFVLTAGFFKSLRKFGEFFHSAERHCVLYSIRYFFDFAVGFIFNGGIFQIPP